MIVMQGRAHMTRPRSSSSCTNMLLGTLGSRTSTPDGIIQIDVLRGGARTREGQLPPMDVPPAAVRAIHVHEILRQTDTDSQCRHCSQQQQLPRQMCDGPRSHPPANARGNEAAHSADDNHSSYQFVDVHPLHVPRRFHPPGLLKTATTTTTKARANSFSS